MDAGIDHPFRRPDCLACEAADPLPPLADRDRFPPLPRVDAQLVESRVIEGKLAWSRRAEHWRQRLIDNTDNSWPGNCCSKLTASWPRSRALSFLVRTCNPMSMDTV